jgi:predicted lipid-binding transport protein (Tim44 family)
MYCANCGTPATGGLSFCNRCGSSLKEREASSKSTGGISAFLTAITLLGILGLGIMLGGSLALRFAGIAQDLIAVFMLLTFLLIGVSEMMLIRNLSKLIATSGSKRDLASGSQTTHELRPVSLPALGEPIGSVTDNTTRTLEYSRREQ